MVRFESGMTADNYQKKLLALINAGVVDKKGGEILVARHDDWCDLMLNGGKCDCDPDIYLKGQKVELPKGEG